MKLLVFFRLRWGSAYSLGTRFSECLPGLFLSCSSFCEFQNMKIPTWHALWCSPCMVSVLICKTGEKSWKSTWMSLQGHMLASLQKSPFAILLCVPWHWWCHKGHSSILRYKGSEPRCWGERGEGIWQEFSFPLAEPFSQAHSLAERRVC